MRELIRGFVEAIVLIPEDGRLVAGCGVELSALLWLSGFGNEKSPRLDGPRASQVTLVAGAGFEPAAFRL